MNEAIDLALRSYETLEKLRKLRRIDMFEAGSFIDSLSEEMVKAVLRHIVYSNKFSEAE